MHSPSSGKDVISSNNFNHPASCIRQRGKSKKISLDKSACPLCRRYSSCNGQILTAAFKPSDKDTNTVASWVSHGNFQTNRCRKCVLKLTNQVMLTPYLSWFCEFTSSCVWKLRVVILSLIRACTPTFFYKLGYQHTITFPQQNQGHRWTTSKKSHFAPKFDSNFEEVSRMGGCAFHKKEIRYRTLWHGIICH